MLNTTTVSVTRPEPASTLMVDMAIAGAFPGCDPEKGFYINPEQEYLELDHLLAKKMAF